MTSAEAVLMDLLLERGYTREQAARALVALTLPVASGGLAMGPQGFLTARMCFSADPKGCP